MWWAPAGCAPSLTRGGEQRQPHQERQVGALGPVLNAVVLRHTDCPHAALEPLRAGGYGVADVDAVRLPCSATPGSASTAPTPSHLAGLRPLRNPAAALENEQ